MVYSSRPYQDLRGTHAKRRNSVDACALSQTSKKGLRMLMPILYRVPSNVASCPIEAWVWDKQYTIFAATILHYVGNDFLLSKGAGKSAIGICKPWTLQHVIVDFRSTQSLLYGSF